MRRCHPVLSALAALTLAASPAGAASTGVVISQVYGGGGNSGSTYTNAFIELFNLGPGAVNLAGWSVQYASAAGNTWLVTNLSGSIQPGQYYLVQQAQVGDGGPDLGVLHPTGDPPHPLEVNLAHRGIPLGSPDPRHRDSVPATPVSTAGCSVPGASVGWTAGWPARYSRQTSRSC